MALAINPRPGEADVFDMFSGKAHIATIRALHASAVSPAAWSWWIVNLTLPGDKAGQQDFDGGWSWVGGAEAF